MGRQTSQQTGRGMRGAGIPRVLSAFPFAAEQPRTPPMPLVTPKYHRRQNADLCLRGVSCRPFGGSSADGAAAAAAAAAARRWSFSRFSRSSVSFLGGRAGGGVPEGLLADSPADSRPPPPRPTGDNQGVRAPVGHAVCAESPGAKPASKAMGQRPSAMTWKRGEVVGGAVGGPHLTRTRSSSNTRRISCRRTARERVLSARAWRRCFSAWASSKATSRPAVFCTLRQPRETHVCLGGGASIWVQKYYY